MAANANANASAIVLTRLQVCTWWVNKAFKKRQWVLVTVPYREAKKMFEARIYDFLRNTGEQRPQIDAWVNKLRKIMEDEEYAPAAWSGCLRESQRNRLEWNEDGTVNVHMGKIPFALIDGNHRGQAIQKYYAIAEKRGDTETMEMLDACDISVQIYLEPERALPTFQALQEGKKVSPDLLALQKMRAKNVKPNANLAFRTAMALHDNKESHLYGKIGTGSVTTNMIGIKTATTSSASEIACSLLGGANIALSFDKGKDEKWLAECYVEAWHTIQHATVQGDDVFGRVTASVIMPGKVLCPLGSHGGKKGGSTLINGVANMWAYMKAVKGLKEMNDTERNHLARVVDEVFDFLNVGGLNAPMKRALMGKFATSYFEPIILGEGERAKSGKVAGSDGIPRALKSDLMAPSSFGPKRSQEEFPDADFILDEYEDDVDANGDGEVVVKTRKVKTHEA